MLELSSLNVDEGLSAAIDAAGSLAILGVIRIDDMNGDVSPPWQPGAEQPRVVLLTSGLNAIARAFAALSGLACGVIRIHGDERESAFVGALRSLRRRLRGQPFATLEDYATHHGLPFREVHKRDALALRATLDELRADLAIVFATPVLSMSTLPGLPLGAINVHGAWLPEYRGGDPLLWLIHEQSETIGVSVHIVDAGVDTGPVLERARVDRPRGARRTELNRLVEVELGVPLLRRAIERLAGGDDAAISQPSASPTRFAPNLLSGALARQLKPSTLCLNALWDLARYLESWPAELGGYRGYRARFRRVPTQLVDEPGRRRDIDNASLEAQGATLWPLHENGRIRLRPRLDAHRILSAVTCATDRYRPATAVAALPADDPPSLRNDDERAS